VSRLPRKIPLLAAVAMAAVAAVTGCSAGQVTQTSTQVATVNGSSANVGQLALRDIRILYPSGGTYAEGSTAQLVLAVANQGLAEDTLIEITGEFFDDAAVSTDDAGDEASVEVEVPAQGILQFGTPEFPSIELADLSAELSVAEIVSMTFVFEQAGEVTVEVPVANPTREISREEGFDFHTEEGE